MSDIAPRCPFCANVLKLQPSIWERIGLKPTKTHCPSCQRSCESRDAHTMGSAFWHWAEQFRKELTDMLQELPILSEPAMLRALGMPHKDDTRLMPSMDELMRTCLRHHREVLIEMAKGRESTLEVVPLDNEVNSGMEAVAVLGTTSSESGAKELEQIVARRGMNHFVLYTYPGKEGAEARVKRAAHKRVKTPRSLMDAHVNAMHAAQTAHVVGSAPGRHI